MYKRILVPVDGSETALLGLDEAIRIAKAAGGAIRLFHAIDDQSLSLAMQASVAYVDNWRDALRQRGTDILEEACTRCVKRGCPAEVVLSETFPEPVHRRVLQEAATWNADLIVVGTHGRRGLRRAMLGSGAEAIVREATVPVLLVRDAAAKIREPRDVAARPVTKAEAAAG